MDLDDVAGMLADHRREAGKGAGNVGQFRAQPDQPALAHQTAHQYRGEKARVDVAAADDDPDPPAAKPLRRGQHRGETGGARTLDDQFLPLEQNLDRALDRHIVNQQNVRDERLDDAPCQPARLLDCDALGEGCGRRRRTRVFAVHQPVHRRIQGRLDANYLDVRVERLGGDCDPGNQPAAADRHDDRVEIRLVGEELERDGALTSDDRRIVVGMDENEPFVASERVGRLTGGAEAVAL